MFCREKLISFCTAKCRLSNIHLTPILRCQHRQRWQHGQYRWQHGQQRWQHGQQRWQHGQQRWQHLQQRWQHGQQRWQHGQQRWQHGQQQWQQIYVSNRSEYCRKMYRCIQWNLSNRSLMMTRQVSSSSVGYSKVALTTDLYPDLKRGPYGRISQTDLDFFENLLPGRLVTNADELQSHNTDWLNICRGSSQLLLKPKTTDEISNILAYCNHHRLAVVPQGGNTGLVGGSVPLFDEIILSTVLMNQIINLDVKSGILTCQAGCILEHLDNYLAQHDLIIPLDLGAKGSCHIGGNVSTNAGGLRLLKYGSLHGTVLGIEAVLADGRIIDCLSSPRKDNTGYDIKQLFIGAEGTLGVVTAVSILCPQRPASVNVAFLGCSTFDQVLRTYRASQGKLGEILSAFEFMDWECMTAVTKYLGLSNPVGKFPFYVLIETSGSNVSHDQEKINSLLESLMSGDVVQDGILAMDTKQIQNLWALRERIAEALMHDGAVYKYDISLPLDVYYNVVEDIRERMKGVTNCVVGYGHVGDANLHLNLTAPTLSMDVLNRLEPYIFEVTQKHHGSISAEHGLGFKKKSFIGYSKKKQVVSLMRDLKKLFDPNAILNPYKTITNM